MKSNLYIVRICINLLMDGCALNLMSDTSQLRSRAILVYLYNCLQKNIVYGGFIYCYVSSVTSHCSRSLLITPFRSEMDVHLLWHTMKSSLTVRSNHRRKPCRVPFFDSRTRKHFIYNLMELLDVILAHQTHEL